MTTILGPKTRVPFLAAACLQRWALLLSAYCYKIEFKPITHHSNADGLSRLPLAQSTPVGNLPEPTVFNLRQIAVLPVDAAHLVSATHHDPTLSRVLRYTQSGWPATGVPAELKAFENHQSELTVESGCILRGIRVLVPVALQKRVLEELHEGHPGIVRMKSLA